MKAYKYENLLFTEPEEDMPLKLQTDEEYLYDLIKSGDLYVEE